MNDFLRDANIPVLTEIIESPGQASFDEAQPAGGEPPAALRGLPPASRTEHVSSMPAAGQDWARLEHEIRERVLRQVMGGIDTILEPRIRDTLADVLQVAVGSLADDIRNGLQQSLEREIARAVSNEIARAQKSEI